MSEYDELHYLDDIYKTIKNEEENKMEVVIFLINNCLKNYLKD